MYHYSTHILAQSSSFDGTVNDTDFWESGLGATMATFMGVLGLIVVVVALINAIKRVADGKIGNAVRGVIGALVLAVFLFQPTLINRSIDAMSSFVESVIETVTTIGEEADANNSNTGGTPTP